MQLVRLKSIVLIFVFVMIYSSLMVKNMILFLTVLLLCVRLSINFLSIINESIIFRLLLIVLNILNFNLKIMSIKYNILVACEESQTSCIAFRSLGCNAFSCDIQPCSGGHPEWHIQSDVLSLINGNCHFITQNGVYVTVHKWDLILAHPPCTYLAASSSPCLFPKGLLNRERYELLKQAASFFMKFYNCNCEHICIENPRPLRIAHLPHPDCVVDPSYFGSKYNKRTYLWLKNLPPIMYGATYPTPKSFVYTRSGSKYRSKSDYLMYNAIANQFVDYLNYEQNP